MQQTRYLDSLLSGDFDSPLKYEYWPALDTSSKKILLVLHGRGDSPEGFHFLPGALDLDSLNIIFLQAPDEYGPGYSWYGMPPNQGPGVQRSRQLLFRFLDQLQSSEKVSIGDVFLLGFSQGCLMSLDLALRYPKIFAGVIGISGYLFFENEYPAQLSPVALEQRIWVSHGLNDTILPIERTQTSMENLKSLGLQVSWNVFDKQHSIDETEEIPSIQRFLKRMLECN